ncbi:alpha/beta fold hydrolase [Bifidobacterium platyrrhinorum]|uniref:Alpha/beta fold hydrolase n=1 Tax=Bifidobacterium platyrrhinorum TaxID=2661628 RepID=A0A6L9SVI9_9BIFI|nr:alpha/beta hydrolase [Bifidobacterium platyrrhinorum]NEG55161.1 alpha/beta fold hydrolase [Bifidobacterium platyrrhinorum]
MTFAIHNRVLRDGDGTPLVLANAYPVDGRMWTACAARIAALADERGLRPFPIWAPDMPGSGLSPAPDDGESGRRAANGSYPDALDRMAESYVDLLYRAGHEQAVWAGLSMGGYLVTDLYRLHPEVVAGVALCDTMASSDGVGGEARLRTSDACEATDSVEPVMHFARPADGDSTVKRSPAFIETMTAWINEQNPAGLAWRQRMTYGRPELAGVPETMDVPVAVVSGELDPTSNPDVMRPLAERIGVNATFTAIPDCGHFSAVEHPDVVAAALVDLVARVQAR